MLRYKSLFICYLELVTDTGNETLTDCSAIFCINKTHRGALMQGKRQVGSNDH